MNDRKLRNAVFVLGLFDTGLHVARILSKYNIEVVGFDYDNKQPGFYSRRVNALLCPNPVEANAEVLRILVAAARRRAAKPVLIPASDEYVFFVNKNRRVLQDYFLFMLPDALMTDNLLNKKQQLDMARRLGLETPSYQLVKSYEALEKFRGRKLQFPIFIKPLYSFLWQKHFKNKGFQVQDQRDFFAKAHLALDNNLAFLVQEIIKGDCSNNFEVSLLYNRMKEIKCAVTVRKIRQYPNEFGTACIIETVNNDDVTTLAIDFVKRAGIYGISNTEFKYEPTVDKYRFIETNVRVWQQIGITETLRCNTALAYYNELTYRDSNVDGASVRIGVKWLDPLPDVLSFINLYKRKKTRVWTWARTFSGVRNTGLFSCYDPKPFLREVGYGRKLLGFFNKLRR